ncbi:MAG: hypothetical protein OHK0012_18830 [Synechococcales cyanobacterium]
MTQPPPSLPPKHRREEGRSRRHDLPRSWHRDWHPSPHRPDPISLIEQSNRGRQPDLLPLRHRRLLQSPFTFLRGTALIMATDLATTPTLGVRVQACGDAHLLNFGGFATPERHVIFDINDFDETLAAPWEWDLKRLAVSVYVAGGDLGLSPGSRAEATRACVRAYRLALRQYSQMSTLEVWYARLHPEALIAHAPDAATRSHWHQLAARPSRQSLEATVQHVARYDQGQWRLRDHPPDLCHAADAESYGVAMAEVFQQYCQSLQGYRIKRWEHEVIR